MNKDLDSVAKESCQDCKHARIGEDRIDGRPPHCWCKKDFEIKTLGIMEWKPVVPCNSFEKGDPDYY